MDRFTSFAMTKPPAGDVMTVTGGVLTAVGRQLTVERLLCLSDSPIPLKQVPSTMRNCLPMFSLMTLLAFGQSVAWAGAYKGIFTGVFYGQGRGCWGGLYIRTRTIEWETNDFSCQRTVYTIVARELHTPFQDYDHIVFRLHHLSRGCPFHYIGLYYYLPPDEIGPDGKILKDAGIYNDWSVAGFSSYRLYKSFPYKKNVDGREWSDRATVLQCGFPYYGKPFLFGKPLD